MQVQEIECMELCEVVFPLQETKIASKLKMRISPTIYPRNLKCKCHPNSISPMPNYSILAGMAVRCTAKLAMYPMQCYHYWWIFAKTAATKTCCEWYKRNFSEFLQWFASLCSRQHFYSPYTQLLAWHMFAIYAIDLRLIFARSLWSSTSIQSYYTVKYTVLQS